MFYVYLLLSEQSKQIYTGFTSNLKRRITEHNSGKGGWTKLRRPLTLIYYEAHLSKKDAMRREQYLKSTKGKTTIRLMLKNSLKIMSEQL